MVPVNDIVHCLLCRGVVTFSDEVQDSIYKDHLKREHRAYFYVNWIVKKTLTEAENENKNKTDIRNYFEKKSPVLGEVKTQNEDGNNPVAQSESCEMSSVADSDGPIEDLAQNENNLAQNENNLAQNENNLAQNENNLPQNENKQSSFETGSVPIMMEDISAIEDVRIDDSNIDDTEDFTEMEDSIDNFTLKSFEQSNSESFEDSTVSSFDDASADLMDINNSTSEPSTDFVGMDDSDFMNDSTLDSLHDSNADTFDDSSFDDTNADLLDDSSMDDSMLNSHLLESEESNEGTMGGTTVTLSDHSLKTEIEIVPNKPDASNETIEISSFTDSEATQVSMQSSDNFENSTSIVENSNAKSCDDQYNDEKNLVSTADHLPSLNEDPQKDVDSKLCESVDTQIEKDLIPQPYEESTIEPNERFEEDKSVASVKPFETFVVRSSDEFHVEDNAEICKDSEVFNSERHGHLEQSKDDEFSVIQQTDNASLCDDSKIISGEVDQSKSYDGISGPTNDGDETSHEDTITKAPRAQKDGNEDQIKPIVDGHIDVKVDPYADVPTAPKVDIELDSFGCASTEPSKESLTEPCQAVNEIPNEDNITAQHEDIVHPSETVNQDNNAVQDYHKDSHILNEDTFEHSDNWNDETFDVNDETFDGNAETFDESNKWNDTTYDETTTNEDEGNFEETGTVNEESCNESMAWNEESYNETDDWNEESYNETDDWNEESYNEMSEPFKETNGCNEESYNESLHKDGEGYNDSNDLNYETNNEIGDKNNEAYNVISDTNEKPYNETADYTDEIYNETYGCNEESYNESNDWNEDSFNELGFWNGESHLAEEAYVEKGDLNDNAKVNEHAENSFGNSNDETLTDIYDNDIMENLSNETLKTSNTNDFNGEQNETTKNSVIGDISSSENEISKKRHLPVDEEEIVPKKILKTTNNEEDNREKKSLHETNNFEGNDEKEKSPLHERKNFACEKCANRYISNFTLERHRSVCKGLKIRACKQKDCKETFASRDDLKLHQKVHNVAEIVQTEIKDASGLVTVQQAKDEKVEKAKDEKPFSCDFCLKRFKTKWYAQMHKETKHSK